MKRVHIAFRTDSSHQVGSGHLMRCLSLAHELQRMDVESVFICREHSGNLSHIVEDAGFQIHRLPAHQTQTDEGTYAHWLGVSAEQDAQETIAIVAKATFDWLIVDHYALDTSWEKRLRPYVNKIAIIDDLANREHDCDLLLDQNYFGEDSSCRYQPYVPLSCHCFLGPQYALLQTHYAALRAFACLRTGDINRVLLFFGSHDAKEHTEKALTALSHLPLQHVWVDVVLGAHYPDKSRIIEKALKRGRATIYDMQPTLAGLMQRADLMIGAGGATTWERLCLGLPAIVLSLADNQSLFTQRLMNEGFQLGFKKEDNEVKAWYETILELMNKPDVLRQMSQKASQLVDGWGAKRMAYCLSGRFSSRLRLRRVKASDEALLLNWANDPVTRLQSFTQKTITPAEHHHWFTHALENPRMTLWIGEDLSGFPLGLLRFCQEQEEMFIGITIDPALRGLGIASLLLKKGLKEWQSKTRNAKMVAEVRVDNEPSQRLFTRLGFQLVSSLRADALRFELCLENDVCEQ